MSQSLTLEHFIRVFPQMLEPDLCVRLMETFEANAQAHEPINLHPVGPQFVQLNLTNIKNNVKVAPVHAALEHAFKAALNRYRKEVGIDDTIWPHRYGFEHFRIKKYDAANGDSFPYHVDVADHASARRFLAVFFYLNDTDGGETSYPAHIGSIVKPQQGSIMMFPPLWLYPHAGEPLKSGVKYICGTYLHYL